MEPHPFFQAVVDAYAAAGRPFFHQVTPREARAMLRASMDAAPAPRALPPMSSVSDEKIQGAEGLIPIRRYVPTGKAFGICVYFHSGGWVIGDLDFCDATCRRLAGAAQCEIVSVDYRLAPEYPFPKPLDDAFTALQWAARTLPGPLMVIGESAGANLAAACTIRARERGEPAIVGQFLAYPVTNDNFNTASYREFGPRNWLLSAADMQWFWAHYCPVQADRELAIVAPLKLMDASGLPPALIYVAALDPLRDEGLAYAQKLARCGVPVSTRCDPGMLHGYLGVAAAIPLAATALAEAARWIRITLRADIG